MRGSIKRSHTISVKTASTSQPLDQMDPEHVDTGQAKIIESSTENNRKSTLNNERKVAVLSFSPHRVRNLN